MNPIVKNILAILAGLVLGSVVNMGIIMASSYIIPPPEGVDATTMEGLKAGMHLFQPKHFIMPFLAHALGTFAGAYIAVRIDPVHYKWITLVIGICFLAGGIMNVLSLPSPLWFTAVDLVGAYIPMAILGSKLARRK